MAEFLALTVPLFLFMLIPLWIPLAAITGGALLDRVAPRRATPTEQAVQLAKRRSAHRRDVEGAAAHPVLRAAA